jgi:hypothetical protein
VADFSVHADRLSAEADERLGDLIRYAVDGVNGGEFVDMKARVFPVEPPAGWRGSDEAQGGWRLRIAMEKVAKPALTDRIQCDAILGTGTNYRPVSSNPMRDGRYWLIDLQKV